MLILLVVLLPTQIMKLTNVAIVTLAPCLGFLFSGILAPPALAGRYVLNQTPATIQRHFGRPLRIEPSPTSPTTKIYTYSPQRIRSVFRDFPRDGLFQMVYVNDRVRSIELYPNPNGGKGAGDGFYTFSPQKFFNYIFGYQPPTWKLLQPSGGNEGFADYRACLGDGVQIHYMQYSLGADEIVMTYNSQCEPPYSR